MKTAYKILFTALCVFASLWFFPWLYTIIFPTDSSDPFVAYSPVSDAFVVSYSGDNGGISVVSSEEGNMEILSGLRKNDRDSLLPQMYFNQLVARGALPDSVAGKEVNIPDLKQSQWVFNSMPRDINRVDARVYPIMESRPKRVDLEDPEQVFTLEEDILFIDMATNSVDSERSARFAKVFADKGFAFPSAFANAQITARKAYDEGYMLVDGSGKVFHMKMQAGMPYLARIELPDDIKATHAFILENTDRKHIALIASSDSSLYAVEREGYYSVKLPVGNIDPRSKRILIMKNLFNWVVKVSDSEGSSWYAIDSDTYGLLGSYRIDYTESVEARVASWLFPFRLTFTDFNDCYAYPRIGDFSLKATVIWLIIALLIIFVNRKRNRD